MTGWHRFPAVKIGHHYLAIAELFSAGRPVPSAGRRYTQTSHHGQTAAEAENALESEIAV